MKITKNKIEKLVSVGDIVFVIHRSGGGYSTATVLSIEEDCLDTDADLLFYEDIPFLWCLCESTAKNITRKSQRNVI